MSRFFKEERMGGGKGEREENRGGVVERKGRKEKCEEREREEKRGGTVRRMKRSAKRIIIYLL